MVFYRQQAKQYEFISIRDVTRWVVKNKLSWTPLDVLNKCSMYDGALFKFGFDHRTAQQLSYLNVIDIAAHKVYRYTLERCLSRSIRSFAALKAVQLGELTSSRRVTSKSDSIFAVESRFYVHH